MSKRTPHKHAEVIKAWADGATVQIKQGNQWFDFIYATPFWNTENEYRVKPPKKTPGQVYHAALRKCGRSCDWDYLSEYQQNLYENSAKAVIEAYKRGEFDDA